MELVVATKNKKKLEEIKEILKCLNLKIFSLADYPKTPRIIENGKTFRENAVKKAVKITKFTQKLTLGEDSGLCVDALEGKPGIYSCSENFTEFDSWTEQWIFEYVGNDEAKGYGSDEFCIIYRWCS